MKNPIDAIGKACPIPFMLAKKEIDSNTHQFSIIVDNKGALENLKRLATSTQYVLTIEDKENLFTITFLSSKKDVKAEQEHSQEDKTPITPLALQSWTLFIGKETMGEGEKELGLNLLRMHLYTINANNDLPKNIVCMNSGVRIATQDQQTIATLQSLEKKGVSIIVCGTCLDYYHLLDELQVGYIGNMYDITKILTSSQKVVSV